MIKSEILDAIREAAAKNGGIPLGQGRFTKETGIQTHIWRGKFWLRWSDAVTEAGFSPNTLTAAYGDEFLLTKLAELARTRGHVPIDTELRFAKSNDESFPGVEAFYRLGSKAERTELLRAFLSQKPEFADVLAILPPQSVIEGSAAEEVSVDDDVVGGKGGIEPEVDPAHELFVRTRGAERSAIQHDLPALDAEPHDVRLGERGHQRQQQRRGQDSRHIAFTHTLQSTKILNHRDTEPQRILR